VAVSASRRKAREAIEAALTQGASDEARIQALALAQVHATLELAFQVGRLADQTPVYGPPEEQ
jgi:hypothetical protein